MRILGEGSGQETALIQIIVESPEEFNILFSFDHPFTDTVMERPNKAYIKFSSVWEMKDFIDMLNRAYKELIKRQGAWQVLCPHCGGTVFKKQKEEKE